MSHIFSPAVTSSQPITKCRTSLKRRKPILIRCRRDLEGSVARLPACIDH